MDEIKEKYVYSSSMKWWKPQIKRRKAMDIAVEGEP